MNFRDRLKKAIEDNTAAELLVEHQRRILRLVKAIDDYRDMRQKTRQSINGWDDLELQMFACRDELEST